jgi:hypothetical protein
MEKVLKALKELNEEIEHILALQVFEGLEILEASKSNEESTKKKKKLQRKGTIKKGEPVVQYIAPDGNKVKVDFSNEVPLLSIEGDFHEETGRT